MANLVTSTENLADTAVWTANSVTVTANTFAAPAFAGGSAGLADTVADNSASAGGSLIGLYYDITADTTSWVGSVYIRKDATTTRWPEVFVQFQGGPAGFVSVNTSTGAIANGSVPPAASGIVDVDASWWRLWIRVVNTSIDSVRMGVYPDHLDALGGATTSPPTGSVVLWGFNLTNTTTVQTYEPQPSYGGGTTTVGLTGVSATGSVGIVTPPTWLTRLVINTGSALNDPTAETIRSGFTKVNTMMPELYTALAPPTGSVLVITTGSALNDPAAEALRSAFGKVNTMATDLYAVAGGTRPVINTGSFNNDPSAESVYSAFTKINTITSDLYAAAAGYGPRVISQPGGSTTITAGSTSAQIQTAVTAAAAGTTFWFPAGTYVFTSNVIPKSNQRFVGQYGAIFEGTTWSSGDVDDAFFKSINNGVTGVTVENLVLQNGPSYGVNSYVTASGWTVTYCEITGNRTGVSVGTAGVISHNKIHHNTGIPTDPDPAMRGGGISLGASAGAQIIYNEISYNGFEQKCGQGGPGLNENVYIAHNWYHHNEGNGVWNDGNGAGTIIEYNTIEDNGGAGIDIEYSSGVTVRYNTIRRQSANEGIYITVSKNTTVTGNVVSACNYGIALFLDFVSLYPNSPDAAWHQDLAANTISGNTVTALAGQKLSTFTLTNKGLGGTSPTAYETNTKNNNWASNTYFAPSTTGNWFLWDNVNNTFAQWQSLPQDTAGSIAVG